VLTTNKTILLLGACNGCSGAQILVAELFMPDLDRAGTKCGYPFPAAAAATDESDC
jgi:hypothetical protein